MEIRKLAWSKGASETVTHREARPSSEESENYLPYQGVPRSSELICTHTYFKAGLTSAHENR
jgi:hypothetical protein